MTKITTASLKKAAKDLNELMGLSPEIDTKLPEDALIQKILEAADMLQEGEEVSETTADVIDALRAAADEQAEEAPAPKTKKGKEAPKAKAGKAKKDPEPEEEEEEEEVAEEEEEVAEEEEEEEEAPKAKGGAKSKDKGKKAPVEEAEEEAEEAPMPKGKGKKEPPKPSKKVANEEAAVAKGARLIEKSRYGSRVGTQAAKIDDALWNDGKGNSTAAIAKVCDVSIARVSMHLAHLARSGLVIKTKGDTHIPATKSL